MTIGACFFERDHGQSEWRARLSASMRQMPLTFVCPLSRCRAGHAYLTIMSPGQAAVPTGNIIRLTFDFTRLHESNSAPKVHSSVLKLITLANEKRWQDRRKKR
ncbi:uncharacterized protein L969DRAFT_95820 [Mixia osmundae IAM 14324]|uniref:Uncharacterized protein n=1 Tax=Mixia osmundae (strain CBS 9802 / IAM 14324 / JCM 22182 / KY 12970) TaxID=764103 RepID=G7DSG9_MIXOS|nr:uncharacterized protein L969DRAFT_95820 [Mixia osmundae IAM 14324]KEI37976.1 hypothetical protein L969DRAFT_95820 [Mixia osmundae IAM 14324]GAA93529.1 hypothetical protein E5Q_00170 [Mixia osmundae IAM 14324]